MREMLITAYDKIIAIVTVFIAVIIAISFFVMLSMNQTLLAFITLIGGSLYVIIVGAYLFIFLENYKNIKSAADSLKRLEEKFDQKS